MRLTAVVDDGGGLYKSLGWARGKPLHHLDGGRGWGMMATRVCWIGRRSAGSSPVDGIGVREVTSGVLHDHW